MVIMYLPVMTACALFVSLTAQNQRNEGCVRNLLPGFVYSAMQEAKRVCENERVFGFPLC